jgi:hypothetical protein
VAVADVVDEIAVSLVKLVDLEAAYDYSYVKLVLSGLHWVLLLSLYGPSVETVQPLYHS